MSRVSRLYCMDSTGTRVSRNNTWITTFILYNIYYLWPRARLFEDEKFLKNKVHRKSKKKLQPFSLAVWSWETLKQFWWICSPWLCDRVRQVVSRFDISKSKDAEFLIFVLYFSMFSFYIVKALVVIKITSIYAIYI